MGIISKSKNSRTNLSIALHWKLEEKPALLKCQKLAFQSTFLNPVSVSFDSRRSGWKVQHEEHDPQHRIG